MKPTSPVKLPWQIDADGWCEAAQRLPSPNHDRRPAGTAIDLLVIHNISLPPGQFGGGWIADLFTNKLDYAAHPYFDQLRSLRVSAHFLIRRDGALCQFVSTLQRAWHAGISQFAGRGTCNDFSIGIELEGTDTEPFTDAQYLTLCALTHSLCLAHPLRAVSGHQHIAPGRKTDPGPFFDWQRYERQWTSGLPEYAPKLGVPPSLHFMTVVQAPIENATKKTT